MAVAWIGPTGEIARPDRCPTTLSREEVVAENVRLRRELAIERLRRVTATRERDRLMARRGGR